jgi:hypothetical protein
MNRELGDANNGRQYCHEYITDQRPCTPETSLHEGKLPGPQTNGCGLPPGVVQQEHTGEDRPG